jgi:hypothetical protein
VQPAITVTRPADAGAAIARAIARAIAATDHVPLLAGDQVQLLANEQLPLRADQLRTRTRPPSLPLLLACLATGRARRVRPLLNLLDGAVLPALLARYVAWSGELAAAAANWDRARIAAMDARLDDQDDVAFVTASAAVTGAERLAADLGDPQLASRLLPHARDARAALQERPLHAAARHLAAWLDLLPPDFANTVTYGNGDAELLLDTVHMIIGVQPDAARHRLWLRPRLPAGWVALSVQDIQCGDDSVRLDAELLPHLLTVRLEQEAGAIPVTALVEPFVPGAVTAVRVDGRSASLAPRAVEGGTRVPVQLVLDRGRVLEIEFEAERPGSARPNAEGPST